MSQPPSLPIERGPLRASPHTPCVTLAFSPSGQRRLAELWQTDTAVEQAWKGEPTPDKADLLTRLQARRDAAARFCGEDFSELLRSSLLFEPMAEEYRVSWADESLRLQSAGGFDVRLTQTDAEILLEGRRRPAFHLYEYLTSKLGPGRCEETRIESAEGLQQRRRDHEGRVIGEVAPTII